jgi:hypothetical protein
MGLWADTPCLTKDLITSVVYNSCSMAMPHGAVSTRFHFLCSLQMGPDKLGSLSMTNLSSLVKCDSNFLGRFISCEENGITTPDFCPIPCMDTK